MQFDIASFLVTLTLQSGSLDKIGMKMQSESIKSINYFEAALEITTEPLR